MSTSHEGDRKPDTQRVNSETSMHNATVTPSKVISVPPEGVLPHDDDCIPSQVVNSSLKTISSHQDLLKFLDVHFSSDGSCSYVTLNADLRPSLAITSRSNVHKFNLPSTDDSVQETKEESLLFLEDRCELWSNYPLSSRRPTYSIQQSEDSFSDTFSCSVTSFRHRFSQFSIDNSCFDIGTCTAENSAVGTPIEKVFPKEMYSAAAITDLVTRENTSHEIPSLDIPPTIDSAILLSDQRIEPTENFPGNDEICFVDNLKNSADGQQTSQVDEDSPVGNITDSQSVYSFNIHKQSVVPLRLEKGLRETVLEFMPSHKHSESGTLMCNISPSVLNDELEMNKLLRLPRLDRVMGRLGATKLPKMPRNRDVTVRRLAGKRYGDLRLIEMLRVRVVQLKDLRGSGKSVFVLAKLDNKDIHHSSAIARDSCDPILDEFFHDATGPFAYLHLVILEGSRSPGKSPRPIGRVSLKRKEVVRLSGREVVLPLRVVSKCPDVQGQICLDIRREKNSFALRVVDYSGLSFNEPQELYLLVSIHPSKETNKLRINAGRFSEEWLEMCCEPTGSLALRMTLWQDLLKGLSSVFHGQIRVDVDERWTNGPSKWFYLRPRHHNNGDEDKENVKKDSLGEMKLFLSFSADHVLPINSYKLLMDALTGSSSVEPFSASLVSLLENMPQVDLSVIARPIVQGLACSKELRPLLSALYAMDIKKCQDLNTLFRSHSLASKMLYELLKIYGHSYLLISLKPVIDKIYKERKCCEIDPSRLPQGESLEKNTANLLSYFSLLFSRVADSASRCPLPIKAVLADLRRVVREKTGKPEMERLALSSFLIMRFFAAAVLSPKTFGIKRDHPEPRVSRTLVLLSKILQRVANCCVSSQTLNSKEPWLTTILSHVTDDAHLLAMSCFLDRISLEYSGPSLSTEHIAVLKDGYLTETCSKFWPSWRKVLHKKKRYVMLTDTNLIWQKSHRGEFNPKGSISLTDIQVVTAESKNVIVVKTKTDEISFETSGMIETTDWISSIERQHVRTKKMSSRAELHDLFESDIEREMEALHVLLVEHADTLSLWKDSLQYGCSVSEGHPPLPKDLDGSSLEEEEREVHRKVLVKTLDNVLAFTYSIEAAHRDAIAIYMDEVKQEAGTKENPIGNDNYLVVKRKINLG